MMDDIDRLLAGIEPAVPARKSGSSPIVPTPTDPLPMHDLLADIQRSQAEIAAAAQRQQAEIEQEQAAQAKLKQQRLEQLRSQRREALRPTAVQWLKQLQPKSDEGRWFAEFACNYESSLEAAIDYLEALEEVNALHPDR
jgi:hypothetical protein